MSRLSTPGAGAFNITPTDNTNLPEVTRALYIGTGGDLTITTVTGDTVTFRNIPDGFLLPFQVARVEATGTLAADIIGIT